MLLHCFPRANRAKKMRRNEEAEGADAAAPFDDSSQAIRVGAPEEQEQQLRAQPREQQQQQQQQQSRHLQAFSSSSINVDHSGSANNNNNKSNRWPKKHQQHHPQQQQQQTMAHNNNNSSSSNPNDENTNPMGNTTIGGASSNRQFAKTAGKQPARSATSTASGGNWDQVGQLLASIERDEHQLRLDLRRLATYLVLIGTDVTIATGHRQARLLAHQSHLGLEETKAVIEKYQLSWHHDCDQRPFDARHNRTLFHIAHRYPGLFLEVAAGLSPGGYEERRFWWCANNWDFYQRSAAAAAAAAANSPASPRPRHQHLLSDVLCHLLEPQDEKLIAVNALHLSVKHSEAQVYLAWFEKNRAWLVEQIRRNEFGRRNPKLKRKLRLLYRLEELERQLATVHVDYFVEWWNLTGLRRPAGGGGKARAKPRPNPTDAKPQTTAG